MRSSQLSEQIFADETTKSKQVPALGHLGADECLNECLNEGLYVRWGKCAQAAGLPQDIYAATLVDTDCATAARNLLQCAQPEVRATHCTLAACVSSAASVCLCALLLPPLLLTSLLPLQLLAYKPNQY
jgi:hypothetical protein